VLRLSAHGLTVCLAILLPGPGTAHAARNEAEAAAQLARVQARIRAATEAVQDSVSKRDSAAAELRTADLAYAAARRRVEDVRARRAASEERRALLRHERERAGRELDTERAALAGQLRSAYLGGPQEQLRVLLNADDPATLGRMLAYYSYLGRARSQRIAAIGAQASRLEALDEALSMEDARLAALEEERRHEALAQDAARASRERALHELEARVASHKEELKDLRANAASLEDLLARLRAALADFDDPELAGPGGKRRPFAQVRGRLPWPARGTLIASFGEPRPGGLRWNGVLLETREGSDVRAPYFGRVVYADWLPGLGLLVILDHGGGYISLYGDNDRLFKAVGDKVRPGEVLATSHREAGARPQLYVEIREGARPLDPRKWLRGTPKP
jgi:septal ring factor EnvC (AmiA/AmiB activator)